MIIVMTGATAGIGAEALNHFTKLSDTKIYVGARGSGRALPEGQEEVSQVSSVTLIEYSVCHPGIGYKINGLEKHIFR